MASITIKNLAKDVDRHSTESADEKYQFVEYEESRPKSAIRAVKDGDEEELEFVKVVDLNPDVSSLDIIEKVPDLTDARQVKHFFWHKFMPEALNLCFALLIRIKKILST